jgi:hypothetical protein
MHGGDQAGRLPGHPWDPQVLVAEWLPCGFLWLWPSMNSNTATRSPSSQHHRSPVRVGRSRGTGNPRPARAPPSCRANSARAAWIAPGRPSLRNHRRSRWSATR